MAYIINIETATEVCSVAISDGQKILFSREEIQGPSHATLLGAFVDEAIRFLREKEITPDALAVSCGPGSYTGLRIGIAEAKGVCYGYNIPLIAIETLKIMAKAALTSPLAQEDALLCPMIDARRMEVYDAVYDIHLNEIKATAADIIDEQSFADLLTEKKVLFFGNGAAKCKTAISHPNATFLNNVYPSASNMAELANQAFIQQDFADIAYFEPFYLKDFIATIPKNKVLGNNS